MAITDKHNRAAGAEADSMLTRPYVIRHIIKESYDTFSLELEPGNHSGKLDFGPGQFNMLYVYGVGEVPISISGDPTKPSVLVHTTREVGAVTSAMRKLRPGDVIGVRGPFGTSWPVDPAKGRDVVVIAGGIGMAPLRPAIYYLLAHREQYKKVFLLYGARTPEDLLYLKDLERWRSRSDLEVHVTVDRATGDWSDNIGVVTHLIPRAKVDPQNCLALVCGPEIMIRFTVMGVQKQGISDDKIYVSMERNMKCGVGLCGHCQLGPSFVCKDGPVYSYDEIKDMFTKREL